jgi:putative transposase
LVTDMIYAATPEEIEAHRKAFIRKWRLKHRAVADSLEEAGERLFTLHSSAAKPMEECAHHQCYRAIARGVQATDQDADGATVVRYCGHAVLVIARLWPDQHAQGRWLANAGHQPIDQPMDLAA